MTQFFEIKSQCLISQRYPCLFIIIIFFFCAQTTLPFHCLILGAPLRPCVPRQTSISSSLIVIYLSFYHIFLHQVCFKFLNKVRPNIGLVSAYYFFLKYILRYIISLKTIQLIYLFIVVKSCFLSNQSEIEITSNFCEWCSNPFKVLGGSDNGSRDTPRGDKEIGFSNFPGQDQGSGVWSNYWMKR